MFVETRNFASLHFSWAGMAGRYGGQVWRAGMAPQNNLQRGL